MSLYPISTFNLGTGYNNGGLFDSLGTAILTDQQGNIIATFSLGIATFPNLIQGTITNAQSAVSSGGANTLLINGIGGSSDYYITFVSNNASTGFQNVYCDGNFFGNPLRYNNSTETLTATIFNGSAVTVNTTTTSASSQYYIPIVSNNATQSGQALNVSQLRFNPGTNKISSTVAGLQINGSCGLLTISLNNAPNTYYLTMVSVNTATVSTNVFVDSYTPYTLSYTPANGQLTAGQLNSTLLILIDQTITSQNASLYANNNVIYTTNNGNRISSFQATTPSGYTANNNLIIGSGDCSGTAGSGTIGLALTDTATNQWALTTSNGLNIYNDNFVLGGVGNVWQPYYTLTNYGLNQYFTNNIISLPMDNPIDSYDNNNFITSAGKTIVPDYKSYITLLNTSANIYSFTLLVNGNNPYGRTISFSTNVGLNFIITAVSGATFPASLRQTPQTPTVSSATLNGSAFATYTFTPTGSFLTNFNYIVSAISVWNDFQPVGQASFTFTPTNTGNAIDTYVFTVNFTKTQILPSGVTVAINTAVGSAFILPNYSITTTTTLVSGSGTLTGLTATPSTTLLSISRSTSTNAPSSGINVNAYGANFGTDTRYTQATGSYNVAGFLNSSQGVGGVVTLQLGKNNTNYNSWFINTANTGTIGTHIYSLSSYGAPNAWQVDGNGNTTQTGYAIADYFSAITKTYGSTSAYNTVGTSLAYITGTYKYKIYLTVTVGIALNASINAITFTGVPAPYYNTSTAQVSLNAISAGLTVSPYLNYSAGSIVISLINNATASYTGQMVINLWVQPDA